MKRYSSSWLLCLNEGENTWFYGIEKDCERKLKTLKQFQLNFVCSRVNTSTRMHIIARVCTYPSFQPLFGDDDSSFYCFYRLKSVGFNDSSEISG